MIATEHADGARWGTPPNGAFACRGERERRFESAIVERSQRQHDGRVLKKKPSSSPASEREQWVSAPEASARAFVGQ